MSSITIPVSVELTPQSRALIDAIVNASQQAKAACAGAITPPAIGQYWPGQGGIYCGVLPAIGGQPAVHMVFSTEEARLAWGPYGEDVEGASSRTNGRANTDTLLSKHMAGPGADLKYPAAQWAANYTNDGHKDFHLPSQAELFMASLHAPQVFNKEAGTGAARRSPRTSPSFRTSSSAARPRTGASRSTSSGFAPSAGFRFNPSTLHPFHNHRRRSRPENFLKGRP